MSRFCVFCGKKPESKTKEHVVPKWLIELTGDPKRQVFLGYQKSLDAPWSKRVFSFDQFAFPACDQCDGKYSGLESEVKGILEKILGDQKIPVEELSLFLDWMDKVRIGLWLGHNQLDKNIANISSTFHIESRIGQYDRLLFIEKSDVNKSRLNFLGTDTPSFAYTPSAFCLVVNGYYLTNISYNFFLSRRLGFPYPTKMRFDQEGRGIFANLIAGSERIMRPLIRRPMPRYATQIFQPMFGKGLISGETPEYDSAYVQAHSLGHKKGGGSIFKTGPNYSTLTEYNVGSSLDLTPAHTQPEQQLFLESAVKVLGWQNWLSDFLPSTENLSLNQKESIDFFVKTTKGFNNKLISQLKSTMA